MGFAPNIAGGILRKIPFLTFALSFVLIKDNLEKANIQIIHKIIWQGGFMTDPYPTVEEILDLVKGIHDAKLVLPEFQRSFIWSNSDIQSLLVSLLNGYFIGTILLLRRGSSFDFKIRYFEGVTDVNPKLPTEPIEKNVEKAVLDGQQRLSAIFYAIYAPSHVVPKGASYPIRYFVNVFERINGKDWEDCIQPKSENDRTRNIEIDLGDGKRKVSFKELLSRAKNFKNLLERQEFKRWCFENGLIPFTVLKSQSELDDWLEDYGDYLAKEKNTRYNEIKQFKKKIREIFGHWFKFKVPTLTLENKSLPEVAEIFERINRTGVELSVFALATAVFFKQGINLRNWWKEYYNMPENPIRNFCDEDNEEYPKIILQVMALLQGKEVKKRVLVNSKELTVNKEKWDEACYLLTDAIKRLQNTTSGYGVIKPKLLPYKPIIVTLAGLLKYCKNDKDFRKLDAWYWSSVLTERYAGASDTAIKQDFESVRKWFKDDEKPAVVVEAQSRIKELDLKRIEKGALCKAILNLIALKGAKDFFTGQSIELVKLNDHHVFPKKSGIKLKHENSILNRTLIQESTNKTIRKKKPSQYIKEMEEKLGGEDKVIEVLKTHLINEKAFSAMKKDDYQEFLTARREAIIAEMKTRINI